VRHVVPDEVQPKRRRGLAKSDQLAVCACTRREPLRADVERFEQVRLTGAVLADDEDDPG
jgi:hypothetical protein